MASLCPPAARFDIAIRIARLLRLGCRPRLPWLKYSFPLEDKLARVTVEDCLEKVGNRFALVILGAERARQLANGGHAVVACNNKPAVTSLREIANGQVHFNENVEGTVRSYLDEVKTRGARPDKLRG